MSGLLDELRSAPRARHCSLRTEGACCLWVRRYDHFHRLRHPADMAEPELCAFLTHLATPERVDVSTQTQALNARLFLYRHVLHRELGNLGELVRARTLRRLLVVLTRKEARAVFGHLHRDTRLVAARLYGSGLRLTECRRLRVLDLEIDRGQVVVRDGKGGEDKGPMLPQAVAPVLRERLAQARTVPRGDLKDGRGSVLLTGALERK